MPEQTHHNENLTVKTVNIETQQRKNDPIFSPVIAVNMSFTEYDCINILLLLFKSFLPLDSNLTYSVEKPAKFRTPPKYIHISEQ